VNETIEEYQARMGRERVAERMERGRKVDAKAQRENQLAALVRSAQQADADLAVLMSTLTRLDGWQATKFLSEHDAAGGFLKVAGDEFRAGIAQALAGVVKALGAARVVAPHREMVYERVKAMTEEEFYS
jgi:hypothetical protein